MPNSLTQDQAQHFVGPDLGQISALRITAEDPTTYTAVAATTSTAVVTTTTATAAAASAAAAAAAST